MHTHLTRSFMALFLMFAGVALFADDSTITFGGASGWSPLSVSNAIARGKATKFAILILVLLLRPEGVLGKATVEKV